LKKIYYAVIVLVLISFTSPAFAISKAEKKEARKFFDNYVTMSNNYDASVAELYSDTAKIHATSRSPEGKVSSVQFPAEKWKEIIVKAMPLAEKRGDISKYKRIKISEKDGKIKIKANRYSLLKCFTDKGYYMVIARDENNEFQIIEEYVETQQKSDCKSTVSEKDLPTLLQENKEQLNILLPVMVDEETKLENAEVTGKTFQYQYVLVNYGAEDLDIDVVKSALLPAVIAQSCTMENLRVMVNKGATISFLYKDKDGKEIITMDVTKADCK
jgi:hypothetical protein